MVAAAVAGGAIVGGVASGAMSSSASKSAASTQADAADYAAQLQDAQMTQTRTDLQPYRDLGTSNISGLQSLANNPLFTQGFYHDAYQAPAAFKAPTAAEAQATPGYQFTLDNGLKAAQNSASSRGLGASGAALKGASAYATGLADSTYGDTFNRSLQAYTTNANEGLQAYNANYNTALGQYSTNQQVLGSQYNRLLGLVTTGQNSAAMTGSLGAQTTSNIANTLTSGAAASAAGQIGAANGISSSISTAVNGGTNALLLNSLMSKTPSASTLYGNSYSGFDNPSNYG